MSLKEAAKMAHDLLQLMSDTKSRAVCEALRDALAKEKAYTAQQIADACIAAEVPDSKYESIMIALEAGR